MGYFQRHQINLTPIFHIFLKVYCKLLSSFIIILNFFSYPHKYIENSSYVFQYKILNFTLISKNNLNCHNFGGTLDYNLYNGDFNKSNLTKIISQT